MNASTFDPEAFENMVLDSANETKMTPVPEGEFRGFISNVRVKSITPKSGANEGKTMPILEVTYQLEDDTGELAKELNRDVVNVRQDIWLDVNDQGGLAFGPNLNVGLGRLREAVGMNKPGKPFTFKQLEGAGPVLVTVTQDVRSDTGDVYNRVPRVAAAS